MTPEALIFNIAVLLGLSVAVIYIGLRLKIPPIVGFLITGVVVGPSGLKIIASEHQVEALSELGVVLLLFTIGLEFSLASLVKIKRTVLLGGSLQVILCIAITWPLALLAGYSWSNALVFGFLFSLSSTAIVLKLFQERGEMDSVHGQSSLAVLIFQDLAVVPMVLALPLLAGLENSEPFYLVALKAAGILAFILLMSHSVVPRLLKRVADTKSRELFLFSVAMIGLGTAWLTAKAGLSLALGAFAAGMVIASSPYAHQAIGYIMPMRDIFTSLFFISIGMQMNMELLADRPVKTMGLALEIMLFNALGTALAMRVVGLNWRVSVMVGFALCQIGEFAFVLAGESLELGLLSHEDMAMFLNVAVITMAITPLAMAAGRYVAPRITDKKPASAGSEPALTQSGHTVIIGFGVVGQGVARACQVAGLPYEIIEMNPHTVQRYQKEGVPIIYGDAVNEAVLEHVGLHRAKVLVVSIPDPVATRRIVAAAKNMNPGLYLIVRTRFLLEMEVMKKLGADEVIPEEYEAAVAVFATVMKRFMVPLDEIEKQLAQARAAGYIMFSASRENLGRFSQIPDHDALLKGLDFVTLTVHEASQAAGRTLAELALRNRFGLNVLLIKREQNLLNRVEASALMTPGDLLICLVADPVKLPEAHRLFQHES
jgi:CPA2 family monovalent cation:H+ antiporter-2